LERCRIRGAGLAQSGNWGGRPRCIPGVVTASRARATCDAATVPDHPGTMALGPAGVSLAPPYTKTRRTKRCSRPRQPVLLCQDLASPRLPRLLSWGVRPLEARCQSKAFLIHRAIAFAVGVANGLRQRTAPLSFQKPRVRLARCEDCEQVSSGESLTCSSSVGAAQKCVVLRGLCLSQYSRR
jgi:hypothetical protein